MVRIPPPPSSHWQACILSSSVTADNHGSRPLGCSADSLCGVRWWCRVVPLCSGHVGVVTLSSLLPSPQIVAFVRREWDGASVWWSRGFSSSSTLRPRSCRVRIRSSWTASVEPAYKHLAGFLTPEPSTEVFQVCWFRSHLVCHVYRSVYSFSWLSSTETPHLRFSGPFRGCPKP